MKMFMSLTGFALAILDFTGLSKKLELKIDSLRKQYFNRVVKDLRFWKIYKRIERIGSFFWSFKTIQKIGIICMLAWAIYFGIRLIDLIRVYEYGTPYRYIFLGVIVVLSIYSVVFYLALSALLIILLTYWSLWWIYLFLHIVNKPKAGTVGTIGLVIAILGLILEFL